MQTKVQIYPSQKIAPIEQLHQPEIPFRAFEVLVSRIKAAIADEQEEQTCVIVQTPNGPEAWYQHTLSPIEQLERDRAELLGMLAQARALLPRDGEAMTPEQVAALKGALAQ